MKRTAVNMGLAARLNEKTGEMSGGFASNLRDALPNASFIGTLIDKTDANTRAVFGDSITIESIPISLSRTKGRWNQMMNRDKTHSSAAVS